MRWCELNHRVSLVPARPCPARPLYYCYLLVAVLAFKFTLPFQRGALSHQVLLVLTGASANLCEEIETVEVGGEGLLLHVSVKSN
jgi:hypothetical protein